MRLSVLHVFTCLGLDLNQDLDLLWFFPGAQPVCLGHYLAPMSTPAPVSEYPTSTLGLSDNPRSKPPTPKLLDLVREPCDCSYPKCVGRDTRRKCGTSLIFGLGLES